MGMVVKAMISVAIFKGHGFDSKDSNDLRMNS